MQELTSTLENVINMSRITKVAIYITLFIIMSLQTSFSQLEAGLKAGASTMRYINDDFQSLILQFESQDDYRISVEDVNFGYHVGLYSRLEVWKLFLQPEIVINSNSVNYRIEDLQVSAADQFLKEQYTSLNIPVVLGIKFGWFSLQGGVSGHIPLIQVSELKNLEGYSINSENFTYSYLGGFGIDIWRFRFDLRYELSTDFFGEHINYKGSEFHFPNKADRLILGVGYEF